MARTMSSVMTYTVINLALIAIWVVPMLVLGICAVILARTKGDAVRRIFTLALKLTFGLFTLALILYTAYDALVFIYYGYLTGYLSFTSGGSSESDYIDNLRDTVSHLSTVARFFENLASILLLVTLVELGNAILTCIGQASGILKNVARFGALAVGGLGFVLDLAEVGKRNAAYNSVNTFSTSSSAILDYYAGLNVANQIGAAFDIIFFITSIAVIVYSSYVMHKTSVARMQKWSAAMLLSAAIINFVRFIWKTAYDAAFTIRLYSNVGRSGPLLTVPMYVRVIDPILNIWPFAVIMILLFVVGIRKMNGLWSNPQAHGQVPTQQYWQPVYQGQPKPDSQGFAPQYGYYQHNQPQSGHQHVPGVAPQGAYYPAQPVQNQPLPVQHGGSPAPAHDQPVAQPPTQNH